MPAGAISLSTTTSEKAGNILVINGPNMNFLGIRETDIYGEKTYEDLLDMIRKEARRRHVRVSFFQSNHEGDIVDKIQEAYGNFDGIIINPAAYTHTSVAIADALKAVGIPAVEVHISDIEKREDFRKVSYVRPVCVSTVSGEGLEGYLKALRILAGNEEAATEKPKAEPRIIETGNYPELRPLFTASGLESHYEGDHPEGMITCWKAYLEGNGIVGGVSIEKKKGHFIIGDIAVKEELRGRGVGTALMKTAVERLESLGAREICLAAKAPGFFEKMGFTYMTQEETPDIFTCKACERLGKTCFPRFMKYDCLKRAGVPRK